MNSNERELELKFTTNSAGLSLARESELLASAEPDATQAGLASVYFDTPGRDLKTRRMVLRVRSCGADAPLMGLKWAAPEAEGPFARGEIEIVAPGPRPDVNLFDEAVAGALRQIIADRPLRPQFKTRIKRRVRQLVFGASCIEAAFDEGDIFAGKRRWPIRELELELKSGEPADLYELGAQLAQSLPLRLDVVSKAQRAFRLIGAEEAQEVKAGALDFPVDVTLDDAFVAVAVAAVAQFVSNWEPLRNGDSPGSIHQMRVALRRLRVVLAMFNRAAPCAEFAAFRATAKRIATGLGAAREYDAFRDLVVSGPGPRFGGQTRLGPLSAAIEGRRAAAYAEAKALVDAPETSVFVLRLQGFLARRGWRGALTDEQREQLASSAKTFAAETLTRMRKRAAKRGRNLVALPDAERHQVRIALKKIRYAAEFFGVLFGAGREFRAYVQTLARLRLLGIHNDAASVERILNALPEAQDPKVARAAGIVMGWCGRDAEVVDAELKKAWKAFLRADRFWR